MTNSLADKIREHANSILIEPARNAGMTHVTVNAGDVHRDLKLENRMPAVCAAIDATKFQDLYGVILSNRSGPKQGSTATWIFSIKK